MVNSRDLYNLSQQDNFKSQLLCADRISTKETYRYTIRDEIPNYITTYQTLFFSQQNINTIINSLDHKIKTLNHINVNVNNYREKLLKLMNDIFIDFNKNCYSSNSISDNEIVMKLNTIVINYLYENIINDLAARRKYIRDIEQPFKLIDHPINPSIIGCNTLENRNIGI